MKSFYTIGSSWFKPLTLLLMLMLMLSSSVLGGSKANVEYNVRQMLTSIQNNHYERFISPTTTQFRAALSKNQFSQLVAGLSSKMKAGYTLDYLTEMEQQGYQVHLWQLKFKDGSGLVVKAVMQGDKIGGFWLQ